MRRIFATTLTLAALLVPAAPAAAQFGLASPEVTFGNAAGEAQMQAGSHPDEFYTAFEMNTKPAPAGGVLPDEELKDLSISFPPGLVGTPTPVPRCAAADFLLISADFSNSRCPISTILGTVELAVGFGEVGSVGGTFEDKRPVFNLVPPPGVPSKLGFVVKGVPVTVETVVNTEPPYNLITHVTNVPTFIQFYGSRVTLWGVPADPSHDVERGGSVSLPQIPFLTMPTACTGPLQTTFEAASWINPGKTTTTTIETNDGGEPPKPIGITGCEKLRFSPTIGAKPTSEASQSPTGLDFSLNVEDEGIMSPKGLAQSQIKKAVVTLPKGMTANPALAEGLEVCTKAQLDAETPFSAPGAGCPNAAKIGSAEVESPLIDEMLKGALYASKPYDNYTGDSLLGLYLVIKNPTLGIVVKQPLRVEPDPETGQLTTYSEDMPQLPFSHFRLHFREGARSPLTTPPSCGSHSVEATLYPYSGGPPLTTSSAFEIVSGPDNKPCPKGGLPPLRPQLSAGTVNNRAGAFSPFNVRLQRSDSEQEITHFSIKLPPGVAGKLAGIPYCSDAQIARAASRTGPHGGAEEEADPSCPAASQVGRTLAGAGVGPSPVFAPGKIYLAGPYKGRPLSMVSVTSGVVGPFDIGTVVVRLAIDVNPETGEVFLDSTGSDPIPHIVKGIVLHVREIRAYTDRPEFTYNPTSCEATSTSATVLGAGLDFVSEADDNPFVSTSRFQAADCAALRFAPKLSFKLKGSTKRAGNPSLRAHVEMTGFGEAAIRSAQVTLPKSAFLDQSHIGTVCTRVQFKEGAVPGERCPAASVYGTVTARTPILSEPLSGPIFLRSNGGERSLPDLVAALHGSQIDVSLVGFIDQGDNGGIRNTFAFVPDAPVTSADFTFFGGKKGLIDNSRNLCKSTNKVRVQLKAHSGKQLAYQTPLVPTGCKKKGKGKKSKSSRAAGRDR